VSPELKALHRLLVIKLGALGDFVLALGPMAAIRRAHVDAHITLMTTAPFVELAEATPYFDSVIVDSRPRLVDIAGWIALRRRLRGLAFKRVYDLQTSDRTGWYFRLLGPGRRPEWSGIARGCSHPHDNPGRDRMHTIDRQAEQLRIAGIDAVPPPDVSWARANLRRFGLDRRYALLVPGASSHRPAKRWPLDRYTTLAREIASRGVKPLLIGGPDERELGAALAARCPDARNFVGETSLIELFALARNAAAAVGNDSGPMHIAALSGAPSVVLFSSESDPALCAPRGAKVTVIRRPELAGLAVGEVVAAMRLR